MKKLWHLWWTYSKFTKSFVGVIIVMKINIHDPQNQYIFFQGHFTKLRKRKNISDCVTSIYAFFSWVCPYYGGKAFFRTFIQDSDHHLQHYRCQPPLALQDLTTKVLETVSLFSMLNVHHVICPCMPCDDASCTHIMLSYMNFPCLRLGFGCFLHDSIHVSCMNLCMDHDLLGFRA